MGTANQKLEDLFGKNSSFTDMSSTEKGLFAEILKEEIEREDVVQIMERFCDGYLQ